MCTNNLHDDWTSEELSALRYIFEGKGSIPSYAHLLPSRSVDAISKKYSRMYGKRKRPLSEARLIVEERLKALLAGSDGMTIREMHIASGLPLESVRGVTMKGRRPGGLYIAGWIGGGKNYAASFKFEEGFDEFDDVPKPRSVTPPKKYMKQTIVKHAAPFAHDIAPQAHSWWAN